MNLRGKTSEKEKAELLVLKQAIDGEYLRPQRDTQAMRIAKSLEVRGYLMTSYFTTPDLTSELRFYPTAKGRQFYQESI